MKHCLVFFLFLFAFPRYPFIQENESYRIRIILHAFFGCGEEFGWGMPMVVRLRRVLSARGMTWLLGVLSEDHCTQMSSKLK